jgi:hypothetical protein
LNLIGRRRVSLAVGLALICAAGLIPSLVSQTFEVRSSTPAKAAPFSVAVGDFNRDGKLDFAVSASDLQVFLGNGDGTFQPPRDYLAGTGALFVTAADLNSDGKLDLVVADLNGLFVLIGNGDGTFQAPVPYASACTPTFVATGDFNGDHKLDLLVTSSSSSCGYVSIFLGNGDGTFQSTPINTPTSYNPGATGIGDFNGDGKLDLAVAEHFGTISQIEILLGNGNGSFSPGSVYSVGSSPDSVAVADFRGNGKFDLAVATLFAGTDILLGNGDGTFQSAGGIATTSSVWVTAADLNGDGKPDLVVAQFGNPGAPDIAVILNNGDGTFQTPVFYLAGLDPRFVGVGDFNGDHKTDIIIPDWALHDTIILLNTGVVAFSPPTQLQFFPQLIGTSSPAMTVTLTNTGKAALSIASVSVQAPFYQTNTCGSSVAAGANCTISVVFKPKAEGDKSGDVSISDSASSKPQVIALTGSGTVVGFSPGTLNFAPQKVGTTSPPQNVIVSNHGTTALTISLIYTSGAGAAAFSETNNCPSSLNAGATCVVAVTFSPKKTGPRSAHLVVRDSGGGGQQGIVLTGTGD